MGNINRNQVLSFLNEILSVTLQLINFFFSDVCLFLSDLNKTKSVKHDKSNDVVVSST